MSEIEGHDEGDLFVMATNPEPGRIDTVIEALSGYVAGDRVFDSSQVEAALELARRVSLRLSTLQTLARDKLLQFPEV